MHTAASRPNVVRFSMDLWIMYVTISVRTLMDVGTEEV